MRTRVKALVVGTEVGTIDDDQREKIPCGPLCRMDIGEAGIGTDMEVLKDDRGTRYLLVRIGFGHEGSCRSLSLFVVNSLQRALVLTDLILLSFNFFMPKSGTTRNEQKRDQAGDILLGRCCLLEIFGYLIANKPTFVRPGQLRYWGCTRN